MLKNLILEGQRSSANVDVKPKNAVSCELELYAVNCGIAGVLFSYACATRGSRLRHEDGNVVMGGRVHKCGTKSIPVVNVKCGLSLVFLFSKFLSLSGLQQFGNYIGSKLHQGGYF